MYIDVFPFEQVPRGSRIILYGFGRTGQHFWRQIEKTKYCELICVVDRNAEKCRNHFVKVDLPEKLFRIPQTDYDYVVIGIGTPDVAEQARDILAKNGIEPDRMIMPDGIPGICDEQLLERFPITEDHLLYEPSYTADYLETFYLFRKGFGTWTEAYYPDVKKVVENIISAGHADALLKTMKAALNLVSVPEAKIIALRLLYEENCFDSGCMEMYAKTLLSMDWTDDTPYGLAVDMAYLTFQKGEDQWLYPDYYLDQRQIYLRLIDYYGIIKKTTRANKEKRIAIVCHELDDAVDNIGPQIVLSYAEELMKIGYEIRIFVSGSLLLVRKNTFLNKQYWMCEENYLTLPWGLHEKSIDVIYGNQPLPQERMQHIVDEICKWSPACILDMADDMAVELFAVYQYIPIIYFPMRPYRTCMVFDAYITRNKEVCRKYNQEFRSIPEKKMVEINTTILLPEKNGISYKRGQFSLNSTDFIMITVGRRLRFEINDELIEAVCDLMKKNPRIVWLLVGDEPVSMNEKWRSLINDGRIRLWGLEEHIDALFRICDIYLQPNRIGGAYSIHQAMRQGIPVLMTDYPNGILQDIPDDMVVHGGYEDLMKEIESLIINKEAYLARSKKVKEIAGNGEMENIRSVAKFCESLIKEAK